MPAKIKGSYPPVTRVATGFPSLDWALRGGAPHRAIWELFGYSQSGKSSLAIKLAAATTGDIAFAEVENRLNIEYLQRGLDSSGYNGTCYLLPIREVKKDEIVSHESIIQEFANCFKQPSFTAGVWDSLGAILPTPDEAEEPGKGYQTERAKLVWDLYRRTGYAIQRARPKAAPPVTGVFFVNHQMVPVTGRGTSTAGGKSTEFLSTIRLKMWANAKDPGDGSLEIKGQVYKGTYGPPGGEFELYLIPEMGLHLGLSAMLDCATLKLCKRESYGVMMAGKSMGRIGDLKDKARAGDNDVFDPFFKALSEFYKTGSFTEAEAAAKEARKPKVPRKAVAKKVPTNGRRKGAKK